MKPEFDPKDSAAQVKSFAIKVQRRLLAAGAASHSLEDVEQELWVAWCKACESFSPTGGASFSTYLHLGMQRHINRYVLNNVTRRHPEVLAASLDLDPTGEGEMTLGDIIPSDELTPEEEVSRKWSYELAISSLSPRSRAFVEILSNQPSAILNEARALEAKSDYAKSIGRTVPVSRRLTTSMIFDLMDASRGERRAIMNEIEGFVASHGL